MWLLPMERLSEASEAVASSLIMTCILLDLQALVSQSLVKLTTWLYYCTYCIIIIHMHIQLYLSFIYI